MELLLHFHLKSQSLCNTYPTVIPKIKDFKTSNKVRESVKIVGPLGAVTLSSQEMLYVQAVSTSSLRYLPFSDGYGLYLAVLYFCKWLLT